MTDSLEGEIDLDAGNQIHSRLNDSNIYNRSEDSAAAQGASPRHMKESSRVIDNDKYQIYINSEQGSDMGDDTETGYQRGLYQSQSQQILNVGYKDDGESEGRDLVGNTIEGNDDLKAPQEPAFFSKLLYGGKSTGDLHNGQFD